MPQAPPKHDDSVPGLSFFRTGMEDDDENEPFEGLTIPRTFISKTSIDVFSFNGSDLTESTINWNNIEDTCFMDCILKSCDLRANSFEACDFDDADLAGSDLRHSEFNGCSFRGASMKGTIVSRDQAEMLDLDEEQIGSIDWKDAPGPEPAGG